MAEQRTYQRVAGSVGHWSWLVVCLLLPISGDWLAVPLVATILALIITGIGRPLELNWRLLWPLFAFYALHILGLAWSTDMAFGLFDIQVKLGLVLLPIAGASLVAFRGSRALHESMVAFAIGLTISIGLSFWKALACFGEHGWIECFTQSYLSFDLHPSYAAWFAAWALWYWTQALINGEVSARWRVPVIVFVALALAFAVMLASKSGLVCLGLVLAFVATAVVRRLRGAARWGTLAAIAVAIAVPAYWLGPVIAVRTQGAFDAVGHLLSGNASALASDNGNDERIVAWGCSAELIRSDALGAGTGDIKHALVACYEAKGAHTAAERRLNSHSQFLQGGVALGWMGLVLAFLVALVPLWAAVRSKQRALSVFMLLFMINAAIESVLEVQAGVIFFSLFLGLLAARERSSPA